MRCEVDQSQEKTRIPEELCTDWLLRLGLVLARSVGEVKPLRPTERVKLRRQIAAAACKKKSVSLSLFS